MRCRNPAACRQICEKLLRAEIRHSHKPPERFKLAFFRTETQNYATYCHVNSERQNRGQYPGIYCRPHPSYTLLSQQQVH